MDGYLIVQDGNAALDHGLTEYVRFAAMLTNGQGFMAWEHSAAGLPDGVLLINTNKTFSFWHGIKRNVSDGREAFSLFECADFDQERHRKAGLIRAASILDGAVLVETDGIEYGSPALWSGRVDPRFVLDARIEHVPGSQIGQLAAV